MEGLLPPVEMGLYMWEFKRNDINKPPIISYLKHLNGGEGGIRTHVPGY